jgi:hypothetical protein
VLRFLNEEWHWVEAFQEAEKLNQKFFTKTILKKLKHAVQFQFFAFHEMPK